MEVPEPYAGGYFCSVDMRLSEKTACENFAVDDLLDFSNEDMIMTDGLFDNFAGNSMDSSTITAIDSSYSSSAADFAFSSDFCVPYDELAQLDWLSDFVEDSFSVEQNNYHVFSGSKPPTPDSSTIRPGSESNLSPTESVFGPEISLPGRVRSKPSSASPGDWSTHLPRLSTQRPRSKKRENINAQSTTGGGERRCLHCGAEKTPQWRTGPMGPKTLCNACGVRHKSGRLVPEYRPAASPTFVSTKHSNSHRKVLELRRQKELHGQQQQQQHFQGSLLGVSNCGDDLLIHRHAVTKFWNII